MPGAFFQCENVVEGCVGLDVGVGDDESGFIGFHAGDHCRFVFDALGTVDKRDAAFPCEGDRHAVVGDRLHNRGDQRDVCIDCGFLSAAVFDDGGTEADVCGHTLAGGVARDEQVFAEGVGGFGKVMRHTA